MGYPDTFSGFCVAKPEEWSTFHKEELKPKPFDHHDIDVEIEACSVCGSDIHTITGGWGEYKGPLCVGHEVVGKAVKVGKHVSGINVGDRVGVGAQVWACLECDLCKSSNENYCPDMVDTYNAQYKDGSWAHGGFASHIRAHEYFVFKIPDKIDSESAAPLLCAGITTYSPMVRAGVGPGKKVGVVGIGGLGHMALQWAAALGAEVFAFTHSPSKKDDAKKLGATEVIVTSDKEDWEAPWKYQFDFVMNCADATDKMDLSKYLSLLKPGGDFHMVGIPDNSLPELSVGVFAANAPKLTGSHLGNHQEMDALLKLAAEKEIRPWIEKMSISEKNLKAAVEKVKGNKVRYRVSMNGFDEAFGRN